MFRQFRSEVSSALTDALASLDLPTDDLGIERPPDDMDATLASSVAFRLAGIVGDAPPNVASDVAGAVDTDGYDYLTAVDTAGPYINFHPGEEYLADTLASAASDEAYGTLPDRDVRTVVEHTSANPTGPVHVGRARNPIVGDAVANVLEYAGYDVDRHYYVNDAGRQMAVFTWAYETFDESDLADDPARDRVEYDLVRYYRKGNEFLEHADPDEVEAAEAEISAILQGLEAGNEATYERVSEVVDAVLGGMKECLARLPAEFDEFIKETQFMLDGSTGDVAERLKETEYAVYEEDAWQLALDEWGIDKNLVFLRSDDTSLYTTRDLAHHEWKFANYDRAVTVLGEDHKLQADQLDATLEILGNDTDALGHVIYSYVNLPDGKMSTRKGTGVMLDDLLDEAVDRAREAVESRMDDRIRDDDLTEEDIERIAHQVGIGAVRYDIVSKQPAKAITFDWDDALDFEGQSAPFVQYVHARCCGILDEAADAGVEVPVVTANTDGTDDAEALDVDASTLETEEARDLLREVARFPAAIEEAADDLEPHTIATFTREFADAYNAFYRECPVLTAKNDDLRDARLAVVAAARHTMANALDVLGVAAPESM